MIRKQNNQRFTAIALTAALGLGLLAAAPAHAGSAGKRNTALLLGGTAVYGVVKKQPLLAGVAGGGALYSYLRSEDDRKRETRQRNRRQQAIRARRATYRQAYYSRARPTASGRKTGWRGRSAPPGLARRCR